MKAVDIGKIGEDAAVKFLRKNGYKLVERNFRASHNEIDIIVKNKESIVFVEVKTRSTDDTLYSDFGTPASAIDRSKIKRTVDAARYYLGTTKFSKLQPRFDVIEVYLSKSEHKIISINHIYNAFGA